MEQRINDLLQEVSQFTATDKASLEAFRLKFISKKGAVAALFEEMKQLPAEKKKETGRILNELKKAAEARFSEISSQLESRAETKTVIDYGVERPVELWGIQQAIDSVSKSIQWTPK